MPKVDVFIYKFAQISFRIHAVDGGTHRFLLLFLNFDFNDHVVDLDLAHRFIGRPYGDEIAGALKGAVGAVFGERPLLRQVEDCVAVIHGTQELYVKPGILVFGGNGVLDDDLTAEGPVLLAGHLGHSALGVGFGHGEGQESDQKSLGSPAQQGQSAQDKKENKARFGQDLY